ncbi:MAG: hypothetical protein B7X02_01695, partial [Rhodospirillales bacterium 12-54-5]
MSGHATHPYHLVNPSKWPILTSFSLLALVVGAAMSLHKMEIGFAVLGVGVMSVIACCFFWWRDVIHEGVAVGPDVKDAVWSALISLASAPLDQRT